MRDALQRPWLLEQMARPRDDPELLLAPELGERLLVDLDHAPVVATDDEERGRADLGHGLAGEIRPATARDHGQHLPRTPRRREQGRSRTRARAEMADGPLACLRLL